MDIVKNPRKKRVLFVSNYPTGKTGFGGFIRELLDYLFRLNKYELAVLGSGVPYKGHTDFARYPYKCFGTIPTHLPEEMQKMQTDALFQRDTNYGRLMIDEVVKEFQPDIIVSSEDSWAVDWMPEKPFFNKLSCIIHTTIDSEPLLEKAVELASKTKYFFSWGDFAVPLFHKKGHTHVKSLHGTVDTKTYKKLESNRRKELRAKHNIPQDAFVTGMVCRNQIRKTLNSVIEGFTIFQKQNPSVKAKLILVTSLQEGWNVKALVAEAGANPEDILFAYKCRATQNYFILPDKGQELDNPITGDKKCLFTTSIQDGISNEQLNEIYNLMDCYTHAMTSGAAERPCLEAKLCELPVLVTDYSCGQDLTIPEAASLPLDYATYLEMGTQFIKAATYPSSVCKQLKKVYEMDNKKRAEMGRTARKFTIDNYSIEVIGKKFEDLLDDLPIYEGDRDFWKGRPANLTIQPPNNFKNAEELILWGYRHILNWEEDQLDIKRPDLSDWKKQLEAGLDPNKFIEILRSAGQAHNNKIPSVAITPEKYLRNAGVKEDAVLIVFKESGGDCALFLSLLPSLRKQYKDHQLVISCDNKFREVFEGSPYLDLIIDFNPFMDSQLLLQGTGMNKPLVYKSLHPRVGTQLLIDYLGSDNIALNLNK